MKKIFILFLCFGMALGCSPTKEVVSRVEGKHFGATISDEGAITYEKLLAKLEKTDKVENVKVKGKIDGVCQAKGCWMNMVSDDPNKASMFVKFKDYGFFVPKDIVGAVVVMEGVAYRETTSVEELRHYAEDEGRSKEEIEKITRPEVELKFMASGVAIQGK